jgi:DNA-binding CsgD family transcriptional regulator
LELGQPLDRTRRVTDVEPVSAGFARSFGECGELLAEAIEAVSLGIVLVATDGRIFYANRMARDLIRLGRGLRSSCGRLVIASPEGVTRLPDLAETGAAPTVGADAKTPIIALSRGAEASHLLAHIVPGQPYVGGAAIFIVNPEHYAILRLDSFAFQYGLTPGEARVLNQIVSGRGLVAASRNLDIAESTTRTHLRRIFGKTGAGRQTELLHLYFTGVLPGAQCIGGAT